MDLDQHVDKRPRLEEIKEEPQVKDLVDIVKRYQESQTELWQVLGNMIQRIMVLEKNPIVQKFME